MRAILTGTRSFGCAALDKMVDDGHDVALVVAPLGDKLAQYAQYKHQLPVACELNETVVLRARADLIVAAHSHLFIGSLSRAATRLGALVGHPSLLPRHRGRDSVEWTIRFRDAIAGFTWFWADNHVDTGPIAKQDWCHVDPTWTASDLWSERLFPMGIELLGRTLAELDRGVLMQIPQDQRFATTEPSLDRTLLHRPELLALGAPAGYAVVASTEDPLYSR